MPRDAEFPTYLSGPRTAMKNPAPQDHRPITCLNNIYKVVTSIINEALKTHEKIPAATTIRSEEK